MGNILSRSRPIRCPNCGVEDEKNGIFCYSCGGQIIYTSHGVPRRSRRGRLSLVRRLCSTLFLLAVPLLAGLYLIGHRLPFCPIVSLGVSVQTESGRSGTGGPPPRFSPATKAFVFRSIYLFTPPEAPLRLKIYRSDRSKPLWTQRVSAGYLAGRVRSTYRVKSARGLPRGIYSVQLVYRNARLARTRFVIE